LLWTHPLHRIYTGASAGPLRTHGIYALRLGSAEEGDTMLPLANWTLCLDDTLYYRRMRP